jgi:hypothetical protein
MSVTVLCFWLQRCLSPFSDILTAAEALEKFGRQLNDFVQFVSLNWLENVVDLSKMMVQA